MTTKISALYDKIITLLGSTLSSYNELPDPYALENNPELYLKAGFGVGIDSGNLDERSVSCSRFMQRDFTVRLVKKITTTKLNKTALKTIQKDLMEDQELVVAAFRDDITLTGTVMEIDYTSDSGVSYLDSGTGKYFQLDTTFEVLYQN